jgi:hypothetical protein
MSKKPSPALAISAVALFAALGGTGLAASSGREATHRDAHAASRVLTRTQVKKLIASYLRAHPHPGPRGPQGAAGTAGTAGTAGAAGQAGAQGPGASQISSSLVGPRTKFPIATVGPWTVSMECTVGLSVSIAGPGNYYYTTVAGAPGTATTTATHIDNGTLGEAGVTVATSFNTQMSADVQLTSGAAMYELRLQMVTTGTSLSNPCTVTGSAIPAS